MDEREAMAFSDGSGSYYMHRAGGVGGSGSGGMFQQTPGFRALSNPHGGSDGSAFSVEVQHGSFNHGGVSNSIGSSSGTVVPYSSDQPVKKKRGRPRKYGPDVPVSLRLSPMSATANSTPDSEKRPRGRPPGSGRKQQLASLGLVFFFIWILLFTLDT
jgi:hypothetical protein